MEHTLASMSTTARKDTKDKKDPGNTGDGKGGGDTKGSAVEMERLVEEFKASQELVKKANKAKRDAAEARKKAREALHKQCMATGQQDLLSLLELDDAESSKSDVSDDVTPKPRMPEWKDEALQTIPNFSCVTDRLMTVEQWCSSVFRLTQQFSGSEAMKVRAIRDAVPIAELKARDVDLTQYSVPSLLAKITAIWNDTMGADRVKAVMVRPQGRSWIEFRHDLLAWAAVHGVPVNDAWLLAQLKANIEMHRDVLSAAEVTSETWARVMDKTEGMYNHARQDVQVSASVATVEADESIDAVKREARGSQKQHRFTSDGKPICDRCHKAGHVKKRCPLNHKKRQNRLV